VRQTYISIQLEEEQKSLNGVVELCLAKMEMDSRERPFLAASPGKHQGRWKHKEETLGI
jgi:hypothetical protein